MRFSNFKNTSAINALAIPHKMVKMEEAIVAYRSGKRVGILQNMSNDHKTGRILLMDNETNFTCDFDYLVNQTWVVID